MVPMPPPTSAGTVSRTTVGHCPAAIGRLLRVPPGALARRHSVRRPTLKFQSVTKASSDSHWPVPGLCDAGAVATGCCAGRRSVRGAATRSDAEHRDDDGGQC